MIDRRLANARAGEEAAEARYRARGYRVVARNWRCRLGELDLVAERRGLLVFCEVKARSPGSFGSGFEAVTRRKQAKLRALAEAFLGATQVRPQGVRFDVASVSIRGGRADVQVFEDAF